ncbi:MAG: ABC transporter permease subunit [Gammaproteobacteria bacterium]|nr:ABC transporter permease subunit [Gammaproteobacteria bacterium]
MLKYFLKRLGIAVPTLILLIATTYAMMEIAPGSPFSNDKKVPPAVMANLEAKYGLDKPLLERVYIYMRDIVVDFDFGPSYRQKDLRVKEILASGLSVTLPYGTLSFLFAMSIGILLGVWAALNQNTWIDTACNSFAWAANMMPNFVLGPILVLVFSLWLGWLPTGGWEHGNLAYAVMPVIALGTSYLANVVRMTRSSMIEVMTSPFIRAAKSKGISSTQLVRRHALRPALAPVLAMMGPIYVYMLTGSIVVDAYFSTGGLGTYFVKAAFSRDYSVMLGLTVVYGTLILTVTLLIDLIYAWVNPKIRFSQ